MTTLERVGLFLLSMLITIAIVISLAQLSHSMTMPKGWGKTHRVVVHRRAPKISKRTWKMSK